MEVAATEQPARRRRDDFPTGFVPVALTSTMLILGVGVIAPALAAISEHFAVSGSAAAALLSSFAAGRFLFTFPAGALADRVGFRPVAVGSCLLALLATIPAALLLGFEVLLVGQFLQGAASAAYSTAALAMFAGAVPAARMGRLLGAFQGLIILVMAFSPLIGGLAVRFIGLSGPFWVCVVGATVGIVVSTWFMPLPEPIDRPSDDHGNELVERSSLRALKRGLSNRGFVVAMLVGVGSMWAFSGIRNTLVPLYAADELEMGAVAVGVVLTAGGVATLLGLMPAGTLVDRLGRRPLAVWGTLGLAMTTVMHAAAQGALLLIAVVVLSGLAKGLLGPVPGAVTADIADAGSRGALMGLSQASISLGLTLGPVTTGWMVDVFGATWAFVVGAGFLGLVALATMWMPETLAGRAHPQPPARAPHVVVGDAGSR